MNIFIYLFVLFIAAGGFGYFIKVNWVHVEKEYSALVLDFGLLYDKGGFLTPPSLRGTYKNFGVEITHKKGSMQTPSLNCFQITFPHSPGFIFRIVNEKGVSRFGQLLGVEDIQTLDISFDDEFLLESSDEIALTALLNYEVRDLIFQLSLQSYDRSFTLTHTGIELQSAETDLATYLKDLIKLGQLVLRPGKSEGKLKNNFISDYNEDVRVNNLNLLLNNYPSYPERNDLIKMAFNDPSGEINFVACKAAPGQIPPGLLDNLWQNAENKLKLKLIEYLSKEKKDFHFLFNKYSPESSVIKEALIRAFGVLGNEKANDLLIRAMGEKDINIASAAVQSLGLCGKPSSIEPLMNLKHPLLKIHAQKALTLIRSRVGENETGWLTLSGEEAEEGALGLTREEGKLSLDD